MADHGELVEGIVDSVGGRDNISSHWHCATRLRMELKDWGTLDKKKLQEIPGVAGVSEIQGQLQVIIGPGVAEVHDQLARSMGEVDGEPATAGIDAPKEKRSIGAAVISTLSKSFIPIIEIIVAASLIKLLGTVIGPDMLGWVGAENHLFILFNLVGDAGFYFLPIFMGMSAARAFGASPMLGMFVGAIFLSPSLMAIVESGEPFSVYGIPMTATNYANATIPAFLTVWVMSYIEKYVRKIVPEALRMMLVPLITILAILPIALTLVGPLATWMGNGLASSTTALASTSTIAYILVGTLIGGVFILAILFGIHVPLFVIAVGLFAANGYDDLILRGLFIAVFALAGMEIGAFFKLKAAKDKSLVASYMLTHWVGGITEPAIFGIAVRYRRPLITACIGAAAGSLFCAIFGVKITTLVAVANLLAATAFLGGGTANAVLGFIGIAIAVVTSAVLTYLFGFKNVDVTKPSAAEEQAVSTR